MLNKPSKQSPWIRTILLALSKAKIFRNNDFQLLPRFPLLQLANGSENKDDVFPFTFSRGWIGYVPPIIAIDQAALFG